jgi:hypothetical protein
MTAPNEVDSFLEGERKYEPLYTALGLAVSHWNLIELQLSLWFHLVTKIEHKVSNDLFFSTTSVPAKIDLIKAGLMHSALPDAEKAFVRAVCTKAQTYSIYRNKFVHGGMHILGPGLYILDFSGQVTREKFDNGITIADLNQAAANYFALMRLMIQARQVRMGEPVHPPVPTEPTLAMLTEQVLLLPNEADAPAASPTQIERLQQSKVDRARNAQKKSKNTGR